MRQQVLSLGTYAAADTNGISLSQTPAAGGIQSLAIDGAFEVGSTGIASLDIPRQVGITTAADETGVIFLIKGTNSKGNEVVEAVVGVNAAVAQTVQQFKTVTSIQVDGDTTGAVEVGTITVVSTNWFPINYLSHNMAIGLLVTVGGATANLDVELTLSNLMSRRGNDRQPTVGTHLGSEFGLIYPALNKIDHSSLAAVTADASGNVAFGITGLRMVSNAAITSGPVTLEIVQAP